MNRLRLSHLRNPARPISYWHKGCAEGHAWIGFDRKEQETYGFPEHMGFRPLSVLRGLPHAPCPGKFAAESSKRGVETWLGPIRTAEAAARIRQVLARLASAVFHSKCTKGHNCATAAHEVVVVHLQSGPLIPPGTKSTAMQLEQKIHAWLDANGGRPAKPVENQDA